MEGQDEGGYGIFGSGPKSPTSLAKMPLFGTDGNCDMQKKTRMWLTSASTLSNDLKG
jgi:hypothetical protein